MSQSSSNRSLFFSKNYLLYQLIKSALLQKHREVQPQTGASWSKVCLASRDQDYHTRGTHQGGRYFTLQRFISNLTMAGGGKSAKYSNKKKPSNQKEELQTQCIAHPDPMGIKARTMQRCSRNFKTIFLLLHIFPVILLHNICFHRLNVCVPSSVYQRGHAVLLVQLLNIWFLSEGLFAIGYGRSGCPQCGTQTT